jgi:peptidoglycan/xylan/chitin deacetylase (PgdA/CDA1 family)
MRTLTTHHIVEWLKPIISINQFISPVNYNKIFSSIAILAYHSISSYRDLKYDRHFTVDPQLFNLQMNYLHKNNFCVINLTKLYEMIQAPVTPNHKIIVLTFDDGYADSYIHAYPILKKYGFNATFFLICNLIGSKRIFPWLREPLFPCGENFPLSEGQILEMAEGGMDFGSHSLSHQRLNRLSPQKAFEEIRGSKIYIQDLLGQEIISFSYPYGSWSDFDRFHQKMVQKVGYRLAVTSIFGSNDLNSNLFLLKRIPIYANDSLDTFEMKINGYYNWIGKIQKVMSFLHRSKEVD